MTRAAAARRGRRLGLVLVLLLVGVAGVGFAVVMAGLTLVAARPAVLGVPPNVLADMEGVSFASGSGSVLHGWWAPPGRAGGGVVMLMPGYRGNRGGMVRRAAVLRREGYGVLLFDFQATGESAGKYVTFGALEGLDVRAAVDAVHGRAPGEKVGVIGVSLGGAAITLAPPPLPVDAVVLESVFPTLDLALRHRLGAAAVLAPVFEALMPVVMGVHADAVRPVVGITRLRAPLLLLSGAADTRTLVAEAEALFAAAPEPKRFWAVPGAGHVDLEAFDPAGYWAQVLPFLAQSMRGGAAAR